jgi:uncharacterized protein
MKAAEFDLRCVCERVPAWGIFFSLIAGFLARQTELPDLGKTNIELIEGDLITPTIVSKGQADIGFSTPPVSVGMAYRGLGPFRRRLANLRAIGTLPHNDRMAWAVPAESGINSIDEMRDKPLRLALPDERSPVRFVVEKILAAYGTTLEYLKSRGWQIIEEKRGLYRVVGLVTEGKADAVIHEGLTAAWPALTESRLMRFLPIRQDVLQKMAKEYGYQNGVMSKGLLRGIEEDVPCIDFSGWMLFVNSDMPDNIAYRITQIFVEKRAAFEAQFRGIPREKSALDCPIDPKNLWRNRGEVPLHPAAERYYLEHGYM